MAIVTAMAINGFDSLPPRRPPLQKGAAFAFQMSGAAM
jgi:hypothetical protein